jgi:hypothetical protein
MWDNTPLVLACHYGHAAVALALLERGADAAAANEQGCTALLYACVESMDEVAARLLQDASTPLSPPAASVYSRLTDETAPRTPLQAAAENGFASGVERLLAGGATLEPDALVLAATRGHEKVCGALVAALAPTDGEVRPGFAEAACKALAAAVGRAHERVVSTLCGSLAVQDAAAAGGGAAMRVACGLSGADGPASGEGSGVRERIVQMLAGSSVSTDGADADGNQ